MPVEERACVSACKPCVVRNVCVCVCVCVCIFCVCVCVCVYVSVCDSACVCDKSKRIKRAPTYACTHLEMMTAPTALRSSTGLALGLQGLRGALANTPHTAFWECLIPMLKNFTRPLAPTGTLLSAHV